MNDGMHSQRLQRLTEQIVAHGLDGLALVPGPNLLYFSGIHAHLSERPMVLIIPADDDPAIIIPTLEAMKAEAAGIAADRIFAWDDTEGFHGAFQQACAHLELADYLLGVEALHMRVLEMQTLQRFAPGLQIAHAEPALSALRAVKEPAEVAAMEKAIAVAEKALQRIAKRIKIGLTERQIAAMLTQELLASGAESIAFGPIVAAGPNSAIPHATPSDRAIRAGDLLVIDWGVYVDGYPSDITRTFAVGPIDPELQRIYEVVKLANEEARRAIRPGLTGRQIDRVARDVIEDAGYGDYFIHRTGHGLGLEIHEAPDMSPANDRPIVAGNVFTIEPGIYLPGRGGVRIEDNVVATQDGSRTLTTYDRELLTVG
ncbi:putative M24B family peptidase [Candidatus Promineifilum breve]|uniref:M24B family peptidase n=1 Tax=Candidatus Promineifilum breve TaxID=1806508 RepID=A0A160T7L7_9CHLR|nr:Xaa-Pro peptidase family protein [Candidatus Promineifilum breve]CUS05982.1 putative M24B family peptidase [Candidatus Promineifilum breve]